MNREQTNAYMREWNRKRSASMTVEERAAHNAKKCALAKAQRDRDPSVRKRAAERSARSRLKRAASIGPEELAAHRARKWEYERRRLESPEARAARRASVDRYRRDKYEKVAEYQKNYKIALKHEMLAAYGETCACCGEDCAEFLTLDHINGDGAAHRREIGIRAGYAMYLYLKKKGWPAGFQTLCFNCNFAKGTEGECPHRRLLMTRLSVLHPSPPARYGVTA